jgi:hypothetical protein
MEEEMSNTRTPTHSLLPCPFCGGAALYHGYPDVRIECKLCKQAMVRASWCAGDLGTMERSWNTRAHRTPDLEGLIKKLEVRLNSVGIVNDFRNYSDGVLDSIAIVRDHFVGGGNMIQAPLEGQSASQCKQTDPVCIHSGKDVNKLGDEAKQQGGE